MDVLVNGNRSALGRPAEELVLVIPSEGQSATRFDQTRLGVTSAWTDGTGTTTLTLDPERFTAGQAEGVKLSPDDREAARKALHHYMEFQSEERFAAGWLFGLAHELEGDPAYDLLRRLAGGTFNDTETFVLDGA